VLAPRQEKSPARRLGWYAMSAGCKRRRGGLRRMDGFPRLACRAATGRRSGLGHGRSPGHPGLQRAAARSRELPARPSALIP